MKVSLTSIKLAPIYVPKPGKRKSKRKGHIKMELELNTQELEAVSKVFLRTEGPVKEDNGTGMKLLQRDTQTQITQLELRNVQNVMNILLHQCKVYRDSLL